MLAVALVGAACGGDDGSATAGDQGTGDVGDLPDGELVLADGTTTTVADLLEGKPLVVNFFGGQAARTSTHHRNVVCTHLASLLLVRGVVRSWWRRPIADTSPVVPSTRRGHQGQRSPSGK